MKEKEKDESQIDEAEDAPRPGSHQTDLAEGESKTVEESIRIHEKKRDIQGRPEKKKHAGAANPQEN